MPPEAVLMLNERSVLAAKLSEVRVEPSGTSEALTAECTSSFPVNEKLSKNLLAL